MTNDRDGVKAKDRATTMWLDNELWALGLWPIEY